MQITKTDDSHHSVVGDLDVSTCRALDASLRKVAAASTLHLDLAGVTFMDSSALRVLIEQHARFEAASGHLGLVNVSSATARLLEISGLDGHLHVS